MLVVHGEGFFFLLEHLGTNHLVQREMKLHAEGIVGNVIVREDLPRGWTLQVGRKDWLEPCRCGVAARCRSNLEVRWSYG